MPSLTIYLSAKPSHSYPIYLANGLLQNPRDWLPAIYQNKQLILITDDIVNPLYARPLLQKLLQQGYQATLFSFLAGEQAKTRETKALLEDQLLTAGCGRNDIILAIGGGVTGDSAGFIAATFHRGIPWIQIPTTLLAMVDSSIGGKTGINTPLGKNMLGAFWQPLCVVADTHCLQTLSQTQRINGLIEALKIFITCDKKKFLMTKQCYKAALTDSPQLLEKIIYQAIQLKAAVIQKDEREENIRMILNFGHTISHAIERFSNYSLPHGYAVGLGILVEIRIAVLLSILSETDAQLITMLFQKLEISAALLPKPNLHEIMQLIQFDKKTLTGHPRYILLEKIGAVLKKENTIAHRVDHKIVEKALFFELGA